MRVDFTLSVRQGIAKLSARAKSVVFALASNYSKTKNSRKIAAERDFREQGGGAEAEASNARQGIARNLPRAQPLKASFCLRELLLKYKSLILTENRSGARFS